MTTGRTLLWLDDCRDPMKDDWLVFSPIERPFQTVWVKSYAEFTDWIIIHGLPDGICFDHDLGEDVAKEKVSGGMSKRQARREKKETRSGMDCAKWLVEYCLDNNLKMPLYNIQSANPAGKENIDGLLKSFIKQTQ